MLVGRETMRKVRNQLQRVPHERIRSVFLVRDGGAQAAQYHRAHFQRRLAEVRDLHVRLGGTHPAWLILADDKLQVVAARSEYEARVVLHVLAADLLRGIHGQFHGVAQLPNTQLPAPESFPGDVDGRVIFLFFRYKWYLRAWNHQRNRKIIVSVVLPEIRRSGVQWHVDPRKLGVQLVLELLTAVGAVQVLEIPSRVITRWEIVLTVRPAY